MTENIGQEAPTRTSRDQATRQLFDTLRACNFVDLRDSVETIVWDAQEHADWISTDRVLNSFNCRDLALVSMRYGTTSFVEPTSPETLFRQFESERFRKFQSTVCDRIEQPEVRSLIFFSQGVKLGAVAMRAKRKA